MKKVVLVDDHEIVRDGIKNLVESSGEYQVVGEATNTAEALGLLEKLRPDVLITDISLQESSGIDLARQALGLLPDLPVLMLSMHDSEDYIRTSLDNGARGYLLKDCTRRELFSALETVVEGKIYVSKSVGQILMNRLLNNGTRPEPVQEKAGEPDTKTGGELTRRELEVLSLIYSGLSNKEIAAKMYLSVRTVDAHRYNMLQKLQVRNTAELLNKAVKYKLIQS